MLARREVPHWREHLQVNRFAGDMLLSRLYGQGRGMQHSATGEFCHHFSLFVLLAGRNRVVWQGCPPVEAVAGNVWLVRGHGEGADKWRLPLNGRLAALHLEFAPERLQRWLEEGVLPRDVAAVQSPDVLQLRLLSARATPVLAQALLQRPFVAEGLPLLELEAAALDLTARLLCFVLARSAGRAQRSRVDEAVDIVRAEFDRELSIAALAQRVGLNECYLKRLFKAQTGETMRFVGYRHAGHFNAVFRRRFGFLPREVRRDGGLV